MKELEYHIKTGELVYDGQLKGIGYSGHGAYKNDPTAVHLKAEGPIPPGLWEIGLPHKHPVLGPCVMNLDPAPGTDTLGRSLFRIHGDNKNHTASEGCIILGPALRQFIADNHITLIKVI